MITKTLKLWSHVLAVSLACSVNAQNVTTLHWFSQTTQGTNADGVQGDVGAIDSVIYGTASGGGVYQWGTVFSLNPDGSNFKTLLSFQGTNGSQPNPGLVMLGDSLFGTTQTGGKGTDGTVFAINKDGTGFRLLHEFSYIVGSRPSSGRLLLLNSMLYGATVSGGSGYGILFRVNLDGSGFTNLHTFNLSSDTANPNAGLTAGPKGLYGTTTWGKSGTGSGSIFRINLDGTGYTNLHTFSGLSGTTNSDGSNPQPSPLLVGNTLYVACSQGGAWGGGTIFTIQDDGSGPGVLHHFQTNDGTSPVALVQKGLKIYGSARNGGASNWGTIFYFQPDGTGFTKLHDFPPLPRTPVEGVSPKGSLITDGTKLYGSTIGPSPLGSLFSITTPTELTGLVIQRADSNVFLQWPDGQILRSRTDWTAPWQEEPDQGSATNGVRSVTNAISAPAKFYQSGT